MNPEKPIFLKTLTDTPQSTPAGGGGSVFLVAANNLSDLTDVPVARNNLGLGSAATTNSTAYDPAGAATAARNAAIAYANALFAGGSSPTGPAGGPVLSGTYPNPTSNVSGSVKWSIVEATRFTFPLVASYPGTGTANLDLTGQNNISIDIVGSLNIVDAASTAGMLNLITVKNTSGFPQLVTWPAWFVANGLTLPPSIANNSSVTFWLQSNTTIGTSVAFYSGVTAATSLVPLTGPAQGRLRKDIAGTITSSSNLSWAAPDWFNVADYGALPNVVANWSPQINACVAAAVAYASTNGCATVFFPDGLWYISAQVIATLGANAKLSIRGTGRYGSMIVAQTTSQNGIYVDLSNGSSATTKSQCEVFDLGFLTTSALQGGVAVYMDYGPNVSNNRFGQCSSTHDVYIDGDQTEAGGWTTGIKYHNCWGGQIHDCQIFGGVGWDAASTPGAGDAGVGSGRAIEIAGGVNQQISNVFMQTWSQDIGLLPLGGVGGAGLVPQGATFSNIQSVNCIEFYHSYMNSSNEGSDEAMMTNFQVDNGNNSKANRWGFIAEGTAFGSSLLVSNGVYLTSGSGAGEGLVRINGMRGCSFSQVQLKSAVATANGISLEDVCSGTTFDCCEFLANPINFGASTSSNQINNTRTSTVTNLGAGTNVTIPGLF